MSDGAGGMNEGRAARGLKVSGAELRELMATAAELARAAGEITLRYFRRAFSAERKADGSWVTAADREAERFLRTELESRFPDDAILGEEEGERAGHSGRRWIIDPVDGTYSFVHGVPFYGVLIGLEIADRPEVGVVYMPALDEMLKAARGQGCYWNGELTRVSSVKSTAEALLLATDFGACKRYGFGAAAAELQERFGARRTWGDCYGHVLVATGRAECMLDAVMNIWDCAPLLPIVEEAGGTFTDWAGQPTIRGGNAISTNGALFDEVMQIVNKNAGLTST